MKRLIMTLFLSLNCLVITNCDQLGLNGLNPFEKDKENNDMLGLALLALSGGAAPTKENFLKTYANIAEKNYSDAYTAALSLQTKVNSFVANPTQTGLNELRTEWRKARVSYLQTEIFRFSNGPIDNKEVVFETISGDSKEIEPLVNAWPLDESYNDYLVTNGIVSKAALLPANEQEEATADEPTESAKHVSVGWHAIEYTLWGKDNAGSNAVTAGQRPLADFVSNANFANRKTYLKSSTDLLVDHITILKKQWSSTDTNSYYYKFTKDADGKSLDSVLRGIAKFAYGEWGGERMSGAASGSQEEEHSCFSDNTKNDFYYDATGFENIFNGTYSGSSVSPGIGLGAILTSEEKSTTLKNITNAKLFCLNEYDEDPSLNQVCPNGTISYRFDQVIVASAAGTTQHTIFTETIQTSVKAIGKTIQAAAKRFGTTIEDSGLAL
ncbi:imelysin family protein [Leptospira sp. 'Mane']|uniref:imelysin family protein n=1 Tax=Leptospira sp. 'Mane' TaxID=3387407 RepID=UPI00398B93CE